MLLQKKYLLLVVVLCMFGFRGLGQTTVIDLASNTVTASDVCPSVSNLSIYAFTLTGVGGIIDNDLSGVTFIQGGTAIVASDVIQYRLWSGSVGGTLLATNTAPAFTFPNIAFSSATTISFFITADISGTPTDGRTISVNAMTAVNLTVSGTATNGATSAGGTQTISAPAVSVSGGGGPFCGNTVISAVGGPTIFFQGTTSGGTSTVLGTTPQNITTSGTYYFRSRSPLTGCWGAEDFVNVIINPLPNVTTFTPTATSVCLGTGSTVSVSSSLSNATYTVTYNLSAPNAILGLTATMTAAAGNGTFTIPPGALLNTGATTITVTSIQNNATSCSSPVSVGNTSLFNVNPLPAITGLATSPPFCFNASVPQIAAFSFSGVSGGADQYMLTWSPSGPTNVPSFIALPGSPLNVNIPAGTVANTYNGTITVLNSVTGCTNTHSISITINPLPTLTGLTSQSICFDASVAQTASFPYSGTTNGANQYTLSWSPSGPANVVAPTALPASPINVNLPAGTPPFTYTGTLTVINSVTGCATAPIISLTVNPLPPPIGNPTPNVCEGDSIQLFEGAGGTWSSGSPGIASVGPTGFVRGLLTGPATITYSFSSTCYATTSVTVLDAPQPIFGSVFNVCIGNMISLTNSSSPGTWSSSNVNATVDVVGNVTGAGVSIAGGRDTIIFTLTSSGCRAFAPITVNPVPSAIAGPSTVCVGSTITLSNINIGGSWSTDNTTLDSIGIATGVVTGKAPGPTIITYNFGAGCAVTTPVTVIDTPTAIIGLIPGRDSVCTGQTITMTSSPIGGTWFSPFPNISIDPFTGVITGNSSGTALISYTFSGCRTTKIVSVNQMPGAITQAYVGIPHKVCQNSSLNPIYSLTNPNLGGIWSSSGSSVTIGSSSGTVTGVSLGNVTISYTLPGGCFQQFTMTVDPLPTPITGNPSVCVFSAVNDPIALASSPGGGTWESSNTAIGTIDATSGMLTGVTGGNITVTYTLPPGGSLNGCKAIRPITVIPSPGTIIGSASLCQTDPSNPAKVFFISSGGGTWASKIVSPLVTYAPAPGITTDSVTVSSSFSGPGLGIDTIVYTKTSTGCKAFHRIIIDSLPEPITGPSSVCVHTPGLPSLNPTVRFANDDSTLTGVLWSSSTPTVATVDGNGIITGVVAGITTITFALPNGCIDTQNITVNSLPDDIVGSPDICTDSGRISGRAFPYVFTDITPAGTWSNASTSVATIGSVSGRVTGVTAGTDVITYTLSTGCKKTLTINVFTTPTVNAVVAPSICSGNKLVDTLKTDSVLSKFSWGVSSNTGNITGASNDTGSIILQSRLTNPDSFLASIIVYTVVPVSVAGSCIGSTLPVSVTVKPRPHAPNIVTYPSTSPPFTLCDSVMSQNFGASRKPYSANNEIFEWRSSNSGQVMQRSGNNRYSLVNFVTPGTDRVTIYTQISPFDCFDSSFVTYTINNTKSSQPNVYFYNDRLICEDTNVNNTNAYQWGFDYANNLDSAILENEKNQGYYVHNANKYNFSFDTANLHYWVMTTSSKTGCTQKTYYNPPRSATSSGITIKPSKPFIQVYPNPAHSSITVDLMNNFEKQDVLAEVYDLVGRKVISTNIADGKSTISIADLIPGSYFLVCLQGGIKVATTRFIKN